MPPHVVKSLQNKVSLFWKSFSSFWVNSKIKFHTIIQPDYSLIISLSPSPIRKILPKMLSTSKHLCHTDNTMFRFNPFFFRDLANLANLHRRIQIYSDLTPHGEISLQYTSFFGGISPYVKKPCTLSLHLLSSLHSNPATFGSPAHHIAWRLVSEHMAKGNCIQLSPYHLYETVNDTIWCLFPERIYKQLNHTSHQFSLLNLSFHLNGLRIYWPL